MMRIERGEVVDDEAAMLAQLDKELGLTPPDPRVKAEELKAKIQEEHNKTLHYKQAGDKN